MSDAPVFPTADQIALAVVMACRFTGDGPIETVLVQGKHPRSRMVAYLSLRAAFTVARTGGLARAVGFHGKPGGSDAATLAQGCAGAARKAAWWRDDWVDEIVGALVGDDIEGSE